MSVTIITVLVGILILLLASASVHRDMQRQDKDIRERQAVLDLWFELRKLHPGDPNYRDFDKFKKLFGNSSD
jgi:hypothetical protein